MSAFFAWLLEVSERMVDGCQDLMLLYTIFVLINASLGCGLGLASEKGLLHILVKRKNSVCLVERPILE